MSRYLSVIKEESADDLDREMNSDPAVLRATIASMERDTQVKHALLAKLSGELLKALTANVR